jgi:hypothetical protein
MKAEAIIPDCLARKVLGRIRQTYACDQREVLCLSTT